MTTTAKNHGIILRETDHGRIDDGGLLDTSDKRALTLYSPQSCRAFGDVLCTEPSRDQKVRLHDNFGKCLKTEE